MIDNSKVLRAGQSNWNDRSSTYQKHEDCRRGGLVSRNKEFSSRHCEDIRLIIRLSEYDRQFDMSLKFREMKFRGKTEAGDTILWIYQNTDNIYRHETSGHGRQCCSSINEETWGVSQ